MLLHQSILFLKGKLREGKGEGEGEGGGGERRKRERTQKNCGTMADDFKSINASTIPGGS